MNIAKIAKYALIVRDLCSRAKQYIVADQNHHYSLHKEARCVLRLTEDNLPLLPPALAVPNASWTSKDGIFSLDTNADGDTLTMTARPFSASTKLWDGPSIIPDEGVPEMTASLYHDLLYSYIGELAADLKCEEEAVRNFADEVLRSVWIATAESESAQMGWLEGIVYRKSHRSAANLAYLAVRKFGGRYRSAMAKKVLEDA